MRQEQRTAALYAGTIRSEAQFFDGSRLAIKHQVRSSRLGIRRREAQCVNPLGNRVDGQSELRVLLLEHQVQSAKYWTGHVPVKVMGLQVQHVGICQQVRKAIPDRFISC